MKRTFVIFAIFAMLVVAVGPVAAAPAEKSYLLLGAGNKLPKGLAAKVSDAGGTITNTIPEIGIAVARSSSSSFSEDAAAIGGISAVVPNVQLQWIDPEFGESISVEYGDPPYSGDDDFYFDLQWGHDAVDAPEAWDVGFRGEGIRVAVLDTGFDLDHVDLAPNINLDLSTNFVPGETLSYALPDPFSHGSHTAGTIAAADNGFGTIGVAPEAELILVKVLGDAGSGAFDWVISGIVYAANVDADIISMSLGARLEKSGFWDEDVWVTATEVQELKNAIARATSYAYQQGATVIASAGNGGEDYDHNADVIHLPSDAPNVISIAATAPYGWAIDFTASLDDPTHYTNYGQSVIDFAAPGGDWDFAYVPEGWNLCKVGTLTRYCFVFDYVFSTGSNLDPTIASYYWGSGTSMAVPHVSGVAAIIIGANSGDMHPAQVEAALRASADDLGKPGNDDFYGAGRVNAYNAVR